MCNFVICKSIQLRIKKQDKVNYYKVKSENLKMNNCISSILSYPFSHIAKLKKLTFQQICLKSTQFYPAYPYFIIASALCNIALSSWMIYYFITSNTNYCYSGVTFGVQILACVYPLYQIVIFLTLIASIGSTKHNWWKGLAILFFTIITTSFGFGGLGIVYACMVHQQDPLAIPSTFLIQNYFIQAIIYAMIVFIAMYCLLVPFTTWLQNRRDPQKERDGCQCCLYAFYIFFQILLFIGTVVFLAIVLGGIPVLFYLLNGIVMSTPMTQNIFFALAINCLVSPYVVFAVVYLFSRFIGCGQQEMATTETQSKQLQLTKGNDQLESSKGAIDQNGMMEDEERRRTVRLTDEISAPNDPKRQVLLESNKSKQFGEDQFVSRRKTKQITSSSKI